MKNCPLCGTEQAFISLNSKDEYLVRCAVCKDYVITEDCVLFDVKRFKEIAYILSGISREHYEQKWDKPVFTSKNIETKITSFPVPDITSVEDKAKKLLLRFKEQSKYFSSEVATKYKSDYPLGYTQNIDEYNGLIKLLEEKKYIKIIDTSIDHGNKRVVLVITADGWELSNDLQKHRNDSDQGFIASWFTTSTNKSIDAIAEAIKESGYKSMCIKNEHFSNKIMEKALGEIRKSRFVVVDLTGSRNSVFFEAGFSYGLNIDCIYVYKENSVDRGSPLDFYVKHYQCYSYKNPTELKEKVKDAIAARIVK